MRWFRRPHFAGGLPPVRRLASRSTIALGLALVAALLAILSLFGIVGWSVALLAIMAALAIALIIFYPNWRVVALAAAVFLGVLAFRGCDGNDSQPGIGSDNDTVTPVTETTPSPEPTATSSPVSTPTSTPVITPEATVTVLADTGDPFGLTDRNGGTISLVWGLVVIITASICAWVFWVQTNPRNRSG